MWTWRVKADSQDSQESPAEPVVVTVVEEVLVAEPAPVPEPAELPVPEPEPVAEPEPVETAPAPAPEPEPVKKMPSKPTEADLEAAKQELVNKIVEKLQGIEGAIVQEVVTAPYDPRFPTTNQNRHCFIRYNEFFKCKFERGSDDNRCQFYKRAYESLCPPEWVEEWDELREQGLWFGKY